MDGQPLCTDAAQVSGFLGFAFFLCFLFLFSSSGQGGREGGEGFTTTIRMMGWGTGPASVTAYANNQMNYNSEMAAICFYAMRR